MSYALDCPEVEVDLTTSKSLFNFDGDWAALSMYIAYFDQMTDALSATLGTPVYAGSFESLGWDHWSSALMVDANHLVIWSVDGRNLYLRYIWEDKEIPILLAVGVEGCEACLVPYPGQFDRAGFD